MNQMPHHVCYRNAVYAIARSKCHVMFEPFKKQNSKQTKEIEEEEKKVINYMINPSNNSMARQ